MQQRFDWLLSNDSHPLPMNIPSMRWNLKIILIGNRETLKNFVNFNLELTQLGHYGEFKSELRLVNNKVMEIWCS